MDLLCDKNQEMTFEEVFQFIEAKEAGTRSASSFFFIQLLLKPQVRIGKPKTDIEKS